jgi:hypothetical protein
VCGLRGDHLLVLVPGSLPDVDALRAAAGPSVAAWGEPTAPGPALLGEVTHVQALMAAALASGITEGSVGPEDLLAQQLVRSGTRAAGVLRRRVMATIEAADRDGLILATLETYLRTGSVPATARHESVHPNTVSYRLKRVQQLTGFDPHVPTEAALLVLALATQEGSA